MTKGRNVGEVLQQWASELERVSMELDLITEVAKERKRQNEEHPEQPDTSDGWNTVLAEEVGEVAKAINDHDPENMRQEIIEVAAVCFRWLSAYDEGY